MNTKKKEKSEFSAREVQIGLFSKEEAAHFFFSGYRHLHSTLLQSSDPLVQQTIRRIKGNAAVYSWETANEHKQILVKSSSEKREAIRDLNSRTDFSNQTQNRDKLEMVLEELLTNALYHSEKNSHGRDFFKRTELVTLPSKKAINIQFDETSNGIHLKVKDHGGSLLFNDFSIRLKNFFSQSKTHIPMEEKHSGAGLGMSLVFQLATHMSISVNKGISTTVSVWLAKTKLYDPDFFSLNFFEE